MAYKNLVISINEFEIILIKTKQWGSELHQEVKHREKKTMKYILCLQADDNFPFMYSSSYCLTSI